MFISKFTNWKTKLLDCISFGDDVFFVDDLFFTNIGNCIVAKKDLCFFPEMNMEFSDTQCDELRLMLRCFVVVYDNMNGQHANSDDDN
jgi:hypothetical protein